MTISSRTPSIAGFITSLITNGHQSTNNWQCVKVSQQHLQPNLELPNDANPELPPGLTEYLVTLSSGEEIYIAAADSMDAAYCAIELSKDIEHEILDIEIVNEQATLFPEQLG